MEILALYPSPCFRHFCVLEVILPKEIGFKSCILRLWREIKPSKVSIPLLFSLKFMWIFWNDRTNNSQCCVLSVLYQQTVAPKAQFCPGDVFRITENQSTVYTPTQFNQSDSSILWETLYCFFVDCIFVIFVSNTETIRDCVLVLLNQSPLEMKLHNRRFYRYFQPPDYQKTTTMRTAVCGRWSRPGEQTWSRES